MNLCLSSYRNFVEDLDSMKVRVLSIPGVVKSQETTWIYYNSNHIRFQMNRAAYYIVSEIAILLVIFKGYYCFIQACNYSEVKSVKHYKDSPLWIQDNVC